MLSRALPGRLPSSRASWRSFSRFAARSLALSASRRSRSESNVPTRASSEDFSACSDSTSRRSNVPFCASPVPAGLSCGWQPRACPLLATTGDGERRTGRSGGATGVRSADAEALRPRWQIGGCAGAWSSADSGVSIDSARASLGEDDLRPSSPGVSCNGEMAPPRREPDRADLAEGSREADAGSSSGRAQTGDMAG